MKNGEFCWNELITPDLNKAKIFYNALFGWQFEDHQVSQHINYTMINVGKEGIGGMTQAPADQKQAPPHWMSYIYVDNLDQSIEKAKSLGATVKVPKTQAGDFGSFAIITDPVGAHIALWESAAK